MSAENPNQHRACLQPRARQGRESVLETKWKRPTVGGRRRLCLADRTIDRIAVVSVHIRNDVPAVRLEALGRVVREPAGNVAVDGDTVIVVEGDELAEAERARERTGFVRDAFHHAAVANEYVCVVIDDFEAGTIEFARE